MNLVELTQYTNDDESAENYLRERESSRHSRNVRIVKARDTTESGDSNTSVIPVIANGE